MFVAWNLSQAPRFVKETSRLQCLGDRGKEYAGESSAPQELIEVPAPVELQLVEAAGDGANSWSNLESACEEHHAQVALDRAPDVSKHAWGVGQRPTDECPA